MMWKANIIISVYGSGLSILGSRPSTKPLPPMVPMSRSSGPFAPFDESKLSTTYESYDEDNLEIRTSAAFSSNLPSGRVPSSVLSTPLQCMSITMTPLTSWESVT